MVLGPRFVGGRDAPYFGHAFFKSHLFPTLWPDMVDLRSASLEIRGRIKKKEEFVVKHKSADMYVGRPNMYKRDRLASITNYFLPIY